MDIPRYSTGLYFHVYAENGGLSRAQPTRGFFSMLSELAFLRKKHAVSLQVIIFLISCLSPLIPVIFTR